MDLRAFGAVGAYGDQHALHPAFLLQSNSAFPVESNALSNVCTMFCTRKTHFVSATMMCLTALILPKSLQYGMISSGESAKESTFLVDINLNRIFAHKYRTIFVP